MLTEDNMIWDPYRECRMPAVRGYSRP